jgi:cellulose synthase operon protein C
MVKTSTVSSRGHAGKSKQVVAMAGLALSLLLAGCGGGSTESMLTSAKEYLAKNDNKAAVIQIKNAIQKNPDSGEARFLLGSVLFKTGDVAGAEVELRKALDLKYAPDSVVPEIARVMLAQGQFKKLTEEFAKTELGSPKSRAELLTVLSSAYGALAKPDLAQSALSSALVADPTHVPALLARARQKAMEKDFDGAFGTVEDITLKNPTNADAWRLKGDIYLFGKNQPDEALAAYRKAIEAKPDLLVAYTSSLTILLSRSDIAEAGKLLEQLVKVAPNSPQTKYLQAQLAYQKRDFKTARELSQQLIKVAPDNPRALQLAGAVELQLNSLLQAELLLNKAVAASPELMLARRMLVMTYLRSGQPAKALTTLNQGIAKGIIDPESDSVAGEVYLQNGDVKKAEEYFAKASKAAPKDNRKRTSLALTQMIAGNATTAFGELQEIAASDTGVTADLALISAHLRRSEFDKALKAIEGLEKKQPDKPLAANLQGRTLLAKKDAAAARKSFERALTIDANFFPAVASLASMDLADKKPEDAKKRFEALLARNPKNVQALLSLAELSVRTGGAKDETAKLLVKAIEANPTDAAPRLLLIDFQLKNSEPKQAMSTAQNAVAALPDSPEILDALGRVQQAAGEQNQAITTFTKLAAMQPSSPGPYMLLAGAHMAAKNKDAAASSLRKALEIKPDLTDAQRGLILLSLEAKKVPEAVALAKTVQKQRPKEAVGYILEGDVNASQKKWDEAAAVYRTGLDKAPAAELAIKLHSSLYAGGKAAEADKLAAGWSKDHANDVAFQFYLGDFSLAKKDYAVAEKRYTTVVAAQPTNAAALNNLAWVMGKLNKPGAVEFAEKANKLAPNQPALMDTLAMLLSDKNEYTKALELQTKVVAAQPQNPMFKLNLAKIHIKGDKKDLARKELDELAKLGDKFAGQAEVASLIKAL